MIAYRNYMKPTKKPTTVQNAGRKGGLSTLRRHGVNHFRAIGKKPKGKKVRDG